MRFVLALLACLNLPLWGMTLESYVSRVTGASAQIRAQNRKAELASGDRWRRFLPNEPQAFFITQDNSGWQQAGLVLNVPFPGRIFFSMGEDAAKSEAEHHEARATFNDVAKLAIDAFLQCASNKDALEIQNENLSDISSFSKRLQTLYEKGHSTQAETIIAQLQLRQLEAEVGIQKDKTAASCHYAERLFPDRVAEGEDFPLPNKLSDQVLGELGDEPPEVLRSRAQVRRAEGSLHTAFWNQLPDLQFQLWDNQYFVAGSSPVGRDHTYSFYVSAKIPIFFPFDENIEASRTRADATIARDQGEVALRQALLAKEQAAIEFQRMGTRLEEIDRKDLPMSDALMDSSLSAYRSGRLGFAELLIARKTRNDLRLQRVALAVSRIQAQLRCLRDCRKEAHE